MALRSTSDPGLTVLAFNKQILMAFGAIHKSTEVRPIIGGCVPHATRRQAAFRLVAEACYKYYTSELEYRFWYSGPWIVKPSTNKPLASTAEDLTCFAFHYLSG